jgi:tetratricopeptide (TPR) repeat protein
VRFTVLGALELDEDYTISVGEGSPERELVRLWLVGRYVVLAAAPLDLSAHYAWMAEELPPGLGDPLLWLGVLALAVSIGLSMRAHRHGDRTTVLFLLAAWLPLAPVLGFVAIGSLFAERHAYHALAGLALLLARGGTALLGAAPQARRVAAVTCLLLVWAVGLGARAWLRVPVWRSATALWSATLEEHPESAFAAVSLAHAHEAAGRVGPARRAAERALELGRHGAAAHLTLGNLALQEGRPRAALAHYRKARRSPSRRFDAQVGLALTHLQLGDVASARALYEELVAERPLDLLVRRIGSELGETPSDPRSR